MPTFNLENILKENSYPGRGIVLGKSKDGKNAVAVYFIMGRSENSRNRVFTVRDGGIITEAADKAKLSDPSLIIYSPVRVLAGRTIVTNGDQTDTIYDTMSEGGSFSRALRKRTFEPDAPNLTPRISGYIKVKNEHMRIRMSILKSNDGNASSLERFFYEYPEVVDGEGRFIHTYMSDGDPLESFYGEPRHVLLDGGIDDIADKIWNSLNEENKVSLFVRFIPLDGSEPQTKIINKYTKV